MLDGHWKKRVFDYLISSQDYHKIVYHVDNYTFNRHQTLSAELIERLIPIGSKILDAGCGYGALYKYIGSKYDYTGVDNQEFLIEFGKYLHPSANLILDDLTEPKLNLGEFDYIIAKMFIPAVRNHNGYEYVSKCIETFYGMSNNILQINSSLGVNSGEIRKDDYILYTSGEEVYIRPNTQSHTTTDVGNVDKIINNKRRKLLEKTLNQKKQGK